MMSRKVMVSTALLWYSATKPLFLDENGINPIQNGLFWGCSRIKGGGGVRKGPPPKILHSYPTMMKLGTVMPDLKKIQRLYESRDTSFEFC